MKIEIGILIALVGCAIGVVGFIKGIKKDTKEEVAENGNQNVLITRMDTKLDFIQNDVKDIKADGKNLREDFSQFKSETVKDLALMKNSVDKAHGRIDSVKEDVKKIIGGS